MVGRRANDGWKERQFYESLYIVLLKKLGKVASVVRYLYNSHLVFGIGDEEFNSVSYRCSRMVSDEW